MIIGLKSNWKLVVVYEGNKVIYIKVYRYERSSNNYRSNKGRVYKVENIWEIVKIN